MIKVHRMMVKEAAAVQARLGSLDFVHVVPNTGSERKVFLLRPDTFGPSIACELLGSAPRSSRSLESTIRTKDRTREGVNGFVDYQLNGTISTVHTHLLLLIIYP